MPWYTNIKTNLNIVFVGACVSCVGNCRCDVVAKRDGVTLVPDRHSFASTNAYSPKLILGAHLYIISTENGALDASLRLGEHDLYDTEHES